MDDAVRTLVIARFSRPDALDAFREQAASPEEAKAAHARKAELEAELVELEREVEAGEVGRRIAAADERRIQAELDGLAVVLRPKMVEPLAEALADTSPVRVAATWDGWTLDQRRSALRALASLVEVPRLGRGRRDVAPSEYVHIVWGPRGV